MTEYKHIPVSPGTYERVREWQNEHFGTDKVPFDETVQQMLDELNN